MTALSAPKKLINQFVEFACVGVIGTVVQYITLISLVTYSPIHSVIASSLGFVMGAWVNYYLNHRYVFRRCKTHREALPKFMTVAGVGFGLNGLLMGMILAVFPWHYLWAQLLATAVVLIWNFVGNRYWTFEHSSLRRN